MNQAGTPFAGNKNFVYVMTFLAATMAIPIGAAAGYFSKDFLSSLGFPYWWLLPILAFVVVGVVTFLGGIQHLKRMEQLAEAAKGVGLEPLSTSEYQKLSSFIKTSTHHLNGLQYAYGTGKKDGRVIFGGYSRRKQGKSARGNIRSSFVLLEFEGPSFPDFVMQQENSLLSLFAKFTCEEGLTFSDDPTFSDHYRVVTSNQDSTKMVFHSELRDFLKNNTGWMVICTGNRLILSRNRSDVSSGEVKAFVSEAVKFGRGVIDLGSKGLGQPYRTPSDGFEKSAETKLSTSELKVQLSRPGSTSLDPVVQDFIAQSIPRDVPDRFRRSFQFGIIEKIMFFMAMSISTIAGSILFLAFQDQPIVQLSVSGGCFVGFLIGFVPLLMGHILVNKKMKILQSGEIIQGHVNSVEPTGIVMANEAYYVVKIDLPDGKKIQASAKGRAALKIIQLKDSKSCVHVCRENKPIGKYLLLEALI